MKLFSQDQLEAIAGALGDTTYGITSPEIEFLLHSSKMVDPGKTTKRIRIYNAFAESQNTKQNRTHVLQFIRLAMSPARYSREPGRFEPMRAMLNQALAFAGLVVDETGKLTSVSAVATLRRRSAARVNFAQIFKGAAYIPTYWCFAEQSCSPTTISMRCKRR